MQVFLWQSAGVFGKAGDHAINFSLLHKLQEKLTDICSMRTSLTASECKRRFRRRNKSAFLQACSLSVKKNETLLT